MDRYAVSLAAALPRVLPEGCSVTALPDPGYRRWARFPARWLAYPRTIDWARWDVVHILDHSYAHVLHHRRGHARTVLTVHDLYAFEPLAQHRGLRGLVLERVNRRVLNGIRRADVCLCDSRATLDAAVRHFPDVAVRMRHEPLGVDQRFFVADLSNARRHGRVLLGIGEHAQMVLHVGSCVPRKNIPALLQAFAQLSSSRPNLWLVQAGGRFSQDHHALIERLGIAAQVLQRPQVGEADLASVYAAADVVAVPSLFEGFGFPVLEAFAVGAPVVATRNTSLADFPDALLESAASGTPDEIAQALHAVLDDRQAAQRRAAAAQNWARGYTWERVAQATARAYGVEG